MRALVPALTVVLLAASCTLSPPGVILDQSTDQAAERLSGTTHEVRYTASTAAPLSVDVTLMDNTGKQATIQNVGSLWSYDASFHSGQYASVFARSQSGSPVPVTVTIEVDGSLFRSAVAAWPASAVAGGFLP